jgi:chemotaxis protein MotB
MKKLTLDEKLEAQDTALEDDAWLWLVPYGDLMTILMVFFMTIFAFAYCSNNINYERFVTKIQKDFNITKNTPSSTRVRIKEEEVEQAYNMSKVLDEKGLSRLAQVEINAQKIRILLQSPVLYAPGNADLSDQSKALLKEIALILRKLPNKVLIEGYTDNVPISTKRFQSNWELSVERAISVVNYLVTEENLAPERLGIAGYGEYQPIFPNDTPEHKARNRRIEIVVLRQKS